MRLHSWRDHKTAAFFRFREEDATQNRGKSLVLEDETLLIMIEEHSFAFTWLSKEGKKMADQFLDHANVSRVEPVAI